MTKTNDLILNSVFLKNRIAELGIKQWWLAEQIGVDRKTVNRWIQGKVKSVQPQNAEALAKILNCEPAALALEDEADQLATVDDQQTAARLLANSSLIEKLGPIGEWDVIEGLLKATVVPHLPLNILGELYNQLTVASWRQSKIDQAEIYNRKAEEIALKSGDKAVLAGALISKANLLSWRGQVDRAVGVYRECLTLEKFIEPVAMASAYSNLGAVLAQAGDLDAGQVFLERALDLFALHGTAMNTSIVWCHLAMLFLEKGDSVSADRACEMSISFAQRDPYARGLAMGNLIRAELLALQNRKPESLAMLRSGLDQFSKLGIEEGLNYEFAGRIARHLDEPIESIRFLEKGIAISTDFPMALAALRAELAKTLMLFVERRAEALEQARKAAELFEACGARDRTEAAKQIGRSRA